MRDFPPPAQYANVLSTPQGIRIAFRDPVLKASTVEMDAQQMPRVRSGAFAVVYKITLPDGRSQAVRLFLKDGDDRRERYALIHEHLARSPLPCLVTFTYADDAFRAADGKRYPMMTMDWVEGETLFDWLHDRATRGDARAIANVAAKWRELIGSLRRANIAHGDLQHANVMVTNAGELKLVDYDGMCVPKLVGRRNLEIGVEPYQHPGRNADTTLAPSLDNFSSLVIQTCLSALAVEPGLWREFVVAKLNEKILFRREDFDDPVRSPLFQRLRRSPDPQVQKLATVIADLWRKRLDQVPALDEVLGTFDFAQVRAFLYKRDFDAALGLLERNAKREGDAPPDLRPRIHDAVQRVAKLGELMQAVEAGNESAMPGLAMSPLLRDYPAAGAALTVARDAGTVGPIISRLEAAHKARRGRDLVKEWDAAQAVLTRPTGALRKSAMRFAADVRVWRERNAACDRVMACLRQAPPDVTELAAAWRCLLALGGHPECDAQRGRIESLIKATPAPGKPGATRVGGLPVSRPPSPTASRPAPPTGSPLGPVAGGRAPTPLTGGAPRAAVHQPTPWPPPSGGAGPDAGVAVPSTPVQPPNAASSGESRLRSVSRDFFQELARATRDVACRWIPPIRWASERTPWQRLDSFTGAMVISLAAGACCGGLVGGGLAQGAIRAVSSLEPSSERSTEWLLWRGTIILVQITLTVTGAALGIAVARNRILRRPFFRIREVGRSALAGLGGGLVAGVVGAGMATAVRRVHGLTGGQDASWFFLGGWVLIALVAAVALWWFSTRVVPNVPWQGVVVVGVLASFLAALVLRSVASVSGQIEWIPLIASAAVGCGAFGGGLALAEALSLRPYIVVGSSDGRQQRLNLGSTPVAAGSDSGRCDIVVSGQMPLALRYWIDAGHCYVLDYTTSQPTRIGVGDRRSLGTSIMTIEALRIGSHGMGLVASASRPAWVASGSRPVSGSRPAPGGTRPAGPATAGSRGAGGATAGPPPPPPPPPRPTA
jgi:hypothetical protein